MDPVKYASNRLNSLKSTGPRTEAGKRRSSLNSTRHSLTGKIHIATSEESEAFNYHCQSYREALAPRGVLEGELAQEIAEDRWRLKRARSLENAIFAAGHNRHVDDHDSGHPEVDSALAEGQTWVEQSHKLQLLTLYESRIRRSIEKNTAELKAMQAERKAAHAVAQAEAIKLARVAASEGVTYNPVPDFIPAEAHGGFVFLPSEIARVTDRKRRLHLAEHLPEEPLR